MKSHFVNIISNHSVLFEFSCQFKFELFLFSKTDFIGFLGIFSIRFLFESRL